MTLTTRLRRLWWRWKFRAVRRIAAADPLTPELVALAWAKAGHLNTANGQWADVILARGHEAGNLIHCLQCYGGATVIYSHIWGAEVVLPPERYACRL